MPKFARRPAAAPKKRRSYPRPPKAAPRRRRHAKRNPPLFSGDLFRDAGLGLAGFVVAHYAGKIAERMNPGGFLGTAAGQTAIQAAVAIGAGHMAGKMMPGARSAVTAGGMVAAGRSLLSKVGIPGLSGLGAEDLSAKDLMEVQALAQELKTSGNVSGLGVVTDVEEMGL